MALTIFAALFVCLFAYFLMPKEIKWVLRSVVDVPTCTSRIADKLNIQHDFSAVKDYIIGSLHVGMTPAEVEKTLTQYGQVHIKNSFTDDEQETNTEILLELCDNPLGNIVLLVYYSKDGKLINIVDPYAE